MFPNETREIVERGQYRKKEAVQSMTQMMTCKLWVFEGGESTREG